MTGGMSPFDAADADEVGAVMAAVAAFIRVRAGASEPEEDRWSRAGRVEALGLSVEQELLDRGWRT